MKKLFIAGFIIFFMVGYLYSEILNPFDMVKEYALTGIKDERGIWAIEFKGSFKGIPYEFGFYYAEEDQSVAILGEWDDEFIFVGKGETRYFMGTNFGLIYISENKAIELASKLIRIMFEFGLLRETILI